MTVTVANWLDHPGWQDADRHFGQLLQRLAKAHAAEAGLAAAVALHHSLEDHACVDLRRVAGAEFLSTAETPGLRLPELDAWRGQLRASGVVGRPGDALPLVLDAADRLYLWRAWENEQVVARGVLERLAGPPLEVDAARLRAQFPGAEGEVDWQQVAVFAAARRRFAVISGGPGTGKTRTVARLIALLCAADPKLRVAVAAPTGKAAARLQEVLRAETDTNAESFPREASTLHRLLGIAPGRPPRHDAERPLPCDLVVVDEASMVDLALMAALFRALPAQARLVLVGDKDQLASVETGTVFSDVCRALGANRFSAAFCAAFQCATGKTLPAATAESDASDAVIQLQRNYRSDAAPDIVSLAAAVRDGDAARVTEKVSQLTGGTASGGVVVEFPANREAWLARLRERLLEHARAFRADATTAERLVALARFRILAPRREGFGGVRHLNELFGEALDAAGARTARDGQHAGRPVIVLENDYALRLFNGDTGVLVDTAEGVRVAFPDESPEGFRLLPPQRLPRHETAHAMTVHKSQGSEFDEVLLVLPDAAHPLLTRELVYTGLTRARRRVTVLAATGALEKAAATPLRRDSGLADLIGGSM